VAGEKISLDSLVVFRNSRGLSGRGTLLHLTRHSVAFEVYNPYSIVQLSEVLQDFGIVREGRPIYQARAVVTTLVPTGALTIVSAALIDPWCDLHGLVSSDAIRGETERFIQGWEQGYRLRPRYQLAVGAMASFLEELSRWLGQAEALYASDSTEPSILADDVLRAQMRPPIDTKLSALFGSFETEAREVPADEIPVHKAFAQRELHPLLLCDPFLHRSFTKPLGYAGDYQVVNMIVGASDHRLNAYARIINMFNLSSPPAVAHRNRLRIIKTLLRREARRRASSGATLRVLNVGCGPAAEIRQFLDSDDSSDCCEFTLMDFNEETLEYAERGIVQAIEEHKRGATLRMVHQSIHDLLEGAALNKAVIDGEYDFVYCAGLFDYLSDRVCRKLVRLYYDCTARGGLVLATNVHARNPIRCYMEHVAEWHLVYRDEEQFLGLAPEGTASRVFTDPTAMNLFLEVRKPGE
jgi:extracellular factor (EF) 3-hydroxypalmitic acid methyl ester biosynthesis protein